MTDEEVADMLLRHFNGDQDAKAKKKNKLLEPYVHKSNVDFDEEGFPNVDALRQAISKLPRQILGNNSKMEHTGGGKAIAANVGIPALHGLVVDKDTGQFAHVNTCPGAGQCKLFCYAMKGSYIQFKGVSMAQTQKLNLLLNDPVSFKRILSAEISVRKHQAAFKDASFIVRWHDSGDFFSEEYARLGFEIANEHPDVLFTAYTKMASVNNSKAPKNFVFTFSADSAHPSQVAQVDVRNAKVSVVVPRELFTDLTNQPKGELIEYNSPEALQTLKDRLYRRYGQEYDIIKDRISTYDDMMSYPQGVNFPEGKKYAVIVIPGNGDDAANYNRDDVKVIFLLIH